jgi:hypothetical protein
MQIVFSKFKIMSLALAFTQLVHSQVFERFDCVLELDKGKQPVISESIKFNNIPQVRSKTTWYGVQDADVVQKLNQFLPDNSWQKRLDLSSFVQKKLVVDSSNNGGSCYYTVGSAPGDHLLPDVAFFGNGCGVTIRQANDQLLLSLYKNDKKVELSNILKQVGPLLNTNSNQSYLQPISTNENTKFLLAYFDSGSDKYGYCLWIFTPQDGDTIETCILKFDFKFVDEIAKLL